MMETMRAVGKNVTRHLPRDVQLSPAHMEALLKGYFHTAAIYGLTLSDAIFFDDAADIRIDQYPLMRSIYSKQPRSKFQTKMYDMLKEATEARRAMRELYRQNEPALARDQALSPENLNYGTLKGAAQSLQGLTRLQRRIADAKGQEQLDEILKNMKSAPIPGKIKFGVRKGKDIGDTKRILIDAVSDMKMAIAKRSVQEVKKRKKDYPALRRELEAQVPGAR